MPTPYTPCAFCTVASAAPRQVTQIDGINPMYAGIGAIALAVTIIAAAIAIKGRGDAKELRQAQEALALQRAANERAKRTTAPPITGARVVEMVRHESQRRFRPIADFRSTQPLDLPQ
jgi:hypothetical protein